MRRLGKVGACFALVARSEELQEKRNEVRKLPRRYVQARIAVTFKQRDHGLASVARFTMDMLEQMQRERAGAIEELNIVGLHIDKITRRNLANQGAHGSAMYWGQHLLCIQRSLKLQRGGL